MLRKASLGSALGVMGLLLLHTGAAAGFDPYASGARGYDYSYIQCGSTAPAASFGIVGINAGYPFTYYNTCLASEFAAASKTGNAAVYINTGYDPSYTAIDGRHTTQDCVARSQSVSGTTDQLGAWAVGCSEAQRDIAYASSQSAASPTAWWLDVETANSWSTSDLSLNQYTITGILETLRAQTAAPIGVYSTSQQWTEIAGGFQAPIDAEWHATGERSLKRARPYCSGAPFSGAKIWLVQYVTSIDNDYVC
jgi:hypothetical protein